MTALHDTNGAPVIVGGGIAGLMTALALAPQPVLLLTGAPLGSESSSALAQGGIAANIGADDSASLHQADTLAAGDGLCDETIAASILAAAPAAIEQLVRFGVMFDRDASGKIILGLEAAHSRRRIIHAGGDATGRDVIRALVRKVRETPSITVIEGATAQRLVVEDNAVVGLLGHTGPGPVLFATDRVVIATGGIGGLFLHGTNPAGSFGQGLALAARAGAVMADLEFIQFHPTALDSKSSPLKLISEAVRGEGAILVDGNGDRFMGGAPGAELASRDIVARAVWRHIAAGHRVFLDARGVKGLDFARRFPAITALCRDAGIDPIMQPIPVRPAAHYHMGGILVDRTGRSSVDGLWACGEAACTGLHGANRLASNSLLEAAVCGGWVAQNIAATTSIRRRQPLLPGGVTDSDPSLVRPILSRAAGVLRDGEGLRTAARALYPLAISQQAASDPAIVGLMIVIAALRRQESRGAHARTDFPKHTSLAQRSTLRLDDALQAARDDIPELVA
ncbi:L-aspartate oxidase [Tardiphaga sp. OK246]|jgi:L-aspartate oxidase|uniref:L-aspartate oxidase n=1 Tax=Tardiphaga sp. OK246 TaxID=1855307 RepID=UPI000B732C88|nr:L-aspartate oxidase [Tardiphaga sp. OK246]SNT63426.1 L-aspartate oxidase [Tardiphaga sp. OK246]